jgi:sugar lactone lactonase YvrE
MGPSISRRTALGVALAVAAVAASPSDASPPVHAQPPGQLPQPGPAGPGAQMITPFTSAPVVSEVTGGLQWAEGPMWNAAAGELVFTDLSADRIYRLSGSTPVVVTQSTGAFANGIEAGTNGSWVVCEHKTQRVRRRSGTTWTTLASTWQGKPFNSPNDNITRSDGTIYFTDPTFGAEPRFGGATPQQGFQGVFRIAPNGTVHLVDDSLQQPNGIALSSNGTKLYVADTQSGAIMRYDVASDGSTGDGEQIATVPQADGMTVDRVGYLYVAAQDGVRVLRASGTAFGTIAVPEQPTNVEFGGSDLKRLFITARTSIYRVDLRIAGISALQ